MEWTGLTSADEDPSAFQDAEILGLITGVDGFNPNANVCTGAFEAEIGCIPFPAASSEYPWASQPPQQPTGMTPSFSPPASPTSLGSVLSTSSSEVNIPSATSSTRSTVSAIPRIVSGSSTTISRTLRTSATAGLPTTSVPPSTQSQHDNSNLSTLLAIAIPVPVCGLAILLGLVYLLMRRCRGERRSQEFDSEATRRGDSASFVSHLKPHPQRPLATPEALKISFPAISAPRAPSDNYQSAIHRVSIPDTRPTSPLPQGTGLLTTLGRFDFEYGGNHTSSTLGYNTWGWNEHSSFFMSESKEGSEDGMSKLSQISSWEEELGPGNNLGNLSSVSSLAEEDMQPGRCETLH